MKKLMLATCLFGSLMGIWYLCSNHVVTAYPGVTITVAHTSTNEWLATVSNGSNRNLTFFGDSEPVYRLSIVHGEATVEQSPAYCGNGMNFREIPAGKSVTVTIPHLDEFAKPGEAVQVLVELYVLCRIPQLGAKIIRLKSEPFVLRRP